MRPSGSAGVQFHILKDVGWDRRQSPHPGGAETSFAAFPKLMSASVKAPVGLSHCLEITIPNKYLPCGSCPRKSLSEEYVQFTVAATTTPGRNTTTILLRLSSLAEYTVNSSKARRIIWQGKAANTVPEINCARFKRSFKPFAQSTATDTATTLQP